MATFSAFWVYSSAARFPGKKQCFWLEKLLLRACREQMTPKHAWRETVGLPKVSFGYKEICNSMEIGFLEESVSNYKGSTQYFRLVDPHSYRKLIQNIVCPLLLSTCAIRRVLHRTPHK